MTHIPAWRRFRQMQDSACIAASLIYAGAALHAWSRLPGPGGLKVGVLLAFPAGFLLVTTVVALGVGPIRRPLARYVWMSFEAGFGQNPLSVLTGMGLLMGAAVLLYVEVGHAAAGGRYPAGAFSGYGAGIGILIAQAALVRTLQRDEAVRRRIEV